MADINRVLLTGRIGTDLELRQTTSGVSVCAFRLAVERPKAKDAEKAETDWFDIVAWRQQAEFTARYLTKGRKVCVDCSARTRDWEDKNGGKHRNVEFIVNQIIPADGKPQSVGEQQAYNAARAQTNNQTARQPSIDDFTVLGGDESDLPF